MPTYDAVRFSPPAAVGAIDLRDAASGRLWANVPMLLDTGADVTLVPSACLNQLQMTFRGRFLMIAQAEGILGRDILNHLNIAFRGPALQWERVT